MLNVYPPSVHHISLGNPLTFSSEIDDACSQIAAACKGLGTDEGALSNILGNKSPECRTLIAARYSELHEKKTLQSLLKSETSGDYGRLLELIAVSLPEAECRMLHKATKGSGTTEKHIIPILMGRTNVEMSVLKKTYYQTYEKDLSVVMDSELSGDFKKVITTSLQPNIIEKYDESYHTVKKAHEDAETLYQAGEKLWGTDEKSFINILVKSPPLHLRQIEAAYISKYKHSIIEAIGKEFSGDAKEALLFLVRMTLEPLDLLVDLFEESMKGLGTDEEGLSSNIVRYHYILPLIKDAYRQVKGIELYDRVKGETSGDYQKLLLDVFNAPTE